jgi:hypothetical protein
MRLRNTGKKSSPQQRSKEITPRYDALRGVMTQRYVANIFAKSKRKKNRCKKSHDTVPLLHLWIVIFSYLYCNLNINIFLRAIPIVILLDFFNRISVIVEGCKISIK